jgi:hypothetical protein
LKEKRGRPRPGRPLTQHGNSQTVLRGARDFRGFGVHTPAVERVIDNLANGGDIRIHIHAITRRQVPNNTFSGNLQNGAGELRKAPCLNMIQSLKPLSQRQSFIKIHD